MNSLKDIYYKTYHHKEKKKENLRILLASAFTIWALLFIPCIMIGLSTLNIGFILLAIGLYLEAYVSSQYLKIDWKPKYRSDR